MEGKRYGFPLWVWFFLGIIPFFAGGFHTYTATVSTTVLIFALLERLIREKTLKIVINLNSITVLIIVFGYCVTPLWAADRGMAAFGALRYLPVLLFALLLMQYSDVQRVHFLSLIPVSGAVMTIVGCVLWLIPAAKDLVVVNGRFSGFLQYPNTFAAFLLTGLAVLCTKGYRKGPDILLSLILIAGIFLSGSRTGVLLLVLLPLLIAVLYKKLSPLVLLVLITAVSFVMYLLINNENRITILGRDIGSLLVRILYYKDAVAVIFQHPFGLGYMGYRALETTFQTSRYTVSFVHSALLQMLLDIGWIPGMLFVIAVVKTVFSPQRTPTAKLVLLILSAHALVDFDLEFFLFWAILLLCMDFETGKVYQLTRYCPIGATAAVLILAVCIWLGLGDWLYRTGNHRMALKVTSFHTDALVEALKTTAEPDQLDDLADKILLLNPTHALAYSAKANAAYSRGHIPEMIRYKEQAIHLTPYTTEEYCDYIAKLYTVLEIYVRTGDHESAAFCLDKLLEVPKMMDAVAARTDPLSHKTGNSSELILPEQYQHLITELANANS